MHLVVWQIYLRRPKMQTTKPDSTKLSDLMSEWKEAQRKFYETKKEIYATMRKPKPKKYANSKG